MSRCIHSGREFDSCKAQEAAKKQPVGAGGTGNSCLCLTGNQWKVGVWRGGAWHGGGGFERLRKKEKDTERKRERRGREGRKKGERKGEGRKAGTKVCGKDRRK